MDENERAEMDECFNEFWGIVASDSGLEAGDLTSQILTESTLKKFFEAGWRYRSAKP